MPAEANVNLKVDKVFHAICDAGCDAQAYQCEEKEVVIEQESAVDVITEECTDQRGDECDSVEGDDKGLAWSSVQSCKK